MKFRYIFTSLLFIFLFQISAVSNVFSQTGKIVGSVTDRNGEPLPAANVLIVGSSLGAATDLDGHYVIVNVPVGTYDVRVTMLGYKTVTQTNVRVSFGQFATVDFTLQEEVIAGEEITVVASQDILHKEVSSSQIVISDVELIEAAGIRTVNDYLAKQAAVTDENFLQIRGGSADQTGTIINGLSFGNPRIGKAEAGIPLSAIEEVSLMTGGYTAEYGNFRSGLVNIITKTGHKHEYHGTFSYSRDNAHMKRFGKSLYDPSNVFLRPYMDPEVAFIGTRDAWPSGDPAFAEENEIYPSFLGWERIAQAYNRSAAEGEEVTPLDLYLWSAWMHTSEPDFAALKTYYEENGLNYTVTQEQIDAIKNHANKGEGSESDYNLDLGFGGPLPFFSQQLGGATFYFSHQTVNTNYVQPVTRSANKASFSMLTLKTNLAQNMTLSFDGIYREENGTLPILGTGGSIPRLGDINDSDGAGAGGGYLMLENNLGRIYDQGQVYFWHPTFYHPKQIQTYMTGVSLNNVVNEKTFWDLKLSYLRQHDNARPEVTRDPTGIINFGPVWVNEMPYGRTFDPDTVYNPNDPNDFYIHSVFEDVGGNVLAATGRRFSSKTGQYHENSVTQQYRVKFDLSSQINRNHFFKTGFEFNQFDLNNDLWVYWKGFDTDYDMRFRRYPSQTGIYLQDQMTFEGMVANVGLRADYYYSGGDVWPTGNLYDPIAFVPGAEGDHPGMDQFRFEFMRAGRNLVWERWKEIDQVYQDSLGIRFLEKTKNHFVLSPRIGISFPVTDRSKFYFNYGHFRSAVPYSEMFMYNFRYSKGQGLNTIGNPNLAPARTISYELGASYNMAEDYLVDLTGYYKDVTGQHANINIDGASIADGYDTRTNNEYFDIQGVELSLRKARGAYLTGWANFRYLIEKNGLVGREFFYEDPERNSDPEQVLYENEEDRPASRPFASASLTFHVPRDLGMGSVGNAVLGGWNISSIFQWQKGRAFTHNPRNLRNVNNNLRWPDYYMLDMKLSKTFSVPGAKVTAYVDIQNVLDLKVSWLQYGWAFRSQIDETNYLNSLHLPMYDSPEYQETVIDPDTGEETVIGRVYDPTTGSRYQSGNDSVGDLKADGKPYINDPNNKDLWLYGQPRDIWIGLNFSF